MKWLITLFLLLSPTAAEAAPPWHDGVSEGDKAAAQRALTEGNALLRHGLDTPALRRYEAALKHWDHPQLHLMRARLLFNLRRPLEALSALWEARRYGGDGLDAASADLALGYERQIVGNQVTLLIIDHDGRGPVRLGAKTILAGGGRFVGFVEAGRGELDVPGRGLVALELHPGRRVQVEIPKAGAPAVSERELTHDDVEGYTRTLPRPPLAVVPGRLPEPVPPPLSQVEALLEPLARDGAVADACRGARARHKARCERHEREIAELRKRIKFAAEEVAQGARKYAGVMRGGVVEVLE